MRVIRAAMKMTVKMEPAAALRVATIRDASAFSNGVVSSLCAIFLATNYALASNGRACRVQEAGRFGLWYDRARSMVSTTRTSVPRGFEHALDSDESWFGLTRNREGTREASILSWTRFHHPSGPQRNATQRNATYWKPVEYVVYEQECTTAISYKSLRSPTRPATHARFVVPSSPATTHGCCTRREEE